MDIEKEIKQVRFTSEYQKMLANILFTASWLNQCHTKKLKPFSLTGQQYNILRILRGQHPKPATINLLIERMIDKCSNASRLVDRLSQKGFVVRTINNEDKRAVNVLITQAGLNALLKIEEDSVFDDSDYQHLTEKEAAELNRLLNKLRK